MRSADVVAALVVVVFANAHVSPALAVAPPPPPSRRPAAAPARAQAPPAPPLPSLPSIARVRLEVARDRMLVVQDINLPRGTWRAGDLDLFVAFGAPGAPEAIDARLLSVKDGALEASAEDAGEPIDTDRAPRRPMSAQPLVGPSTMAGVILHVKEASFRRCTEGGAMAAVRVRTILALPAEDARTGREVVVRLGAASGTPLTLGRVQIASTDPKWLQRAEAHLCGADADPWPLAIAVVPKPVQAPPRTPQLPIAPVLSVRHASDDLCVRFWTAP